MPHLLSAREISYFDRFYYFSHFFICKATQISDTWVTSPSIWRQYYLNLGYLEGACVVVATPKEMELAIPVQILDVLICVSLRANVFEKSMNPSILNIKADWIL